MWTFREQEEASFTTLKRSLLSYRNLTHVDINNFAYWPLTARPNGLASLLKANNQWKLTFLLWPLRARVSLLNDLRRCTAVFLDGSHWMNTDDWSTTKRAVVTDPDVKCWRIDFFHGKILWKKKKTSRKDWLEGLMMELSVLFMSRIWRNINKCDSVDGSLRKI